MENEKYIITEGTYIYKTPKQPKPSDLYNIDETAEERAERIYLYNEVIENE